LRISPSRLLDTAYSAATIATSIAKLEKEFEDIKRSADNDYVDAVDLSGPAESMLLSQSSGKLIAESLETPELAVEIERAIAQIEKTLKAEKLEEQEKRQQRAVEKEVGSKKWYRCVAVWSEATILSPSMRSRGKYTQNSFPRAPWTEFLEYIIRDIEEAPSHLQLSYRQMDELLLHLPPCRLYGIFLNDMPLERRSSRVASCCCYFSAVVFKEKMQQG